MEAISDAVRRRFAIVKTTLGKRLHLFIRITANLLPVSCDLPS